jgi:DNA (cytosine-5)-methyltransferase 1
LRAHRGVGCGWGREPWGWSRVGRACEDRSAVELPVIDIFAGPGGLSEGFSRYGEADWEAVLSKPIAEKRETLRAVPKHAFRVELSIEKDAFAHQTLQLRALARLMRTRGLEREYLEALGQRGGPRRLLESDDSKIAALVAKAKEEAWCATLGEVAETELDQRIEVALDGADQWVLIGGPPCQAYSLVGRARNKGIDSYVPENDHRHFLYKEYLGIVARHNPPVFVLENVKGLLSSEVGGRRIFERIVDDLRAPGRAVGRRGATPNYRLIPVVAPETEDCFGEFQPEQYVVRMEQHGIPQARHRVILVGVREDITRPQRLLEPREPVAAGRVLDGLVSLRSGLSDVPDSFEAWAANLRDAARSKWARRSPEIGSRIREVVDSLPLPSDRGCELIARHRPSRYAAEWFGKNLRATLNHATRSHMSDDLRRYLFAACYADAHGVSPTLPSFPEELLPNHRSARVAVRNGGHFGDRFRVQVSGRPSTTVTSHISKDGHYYIHPDATQCRSLTVREAARLQTFPDDYLFCGPRTEQYHQVGNAVPPLLAVQIAHVVEGLLS